MPVVAKLHAYFDVAAWRTAEITFISSLSPGIKNLLMQRVNQALLEAWDRGYEEGRKTESLMNAFMRTTP